MGKKLISRVLLCDEDDVGNVLLHMPVGLIAGAAALVSGWICLIFGLGFLAYELREAKIIEDKAYPDIQGFLWGLGIFVVLYLVWGVFV